MSDEPFDADDLRDTAGYLESQGIGERDQEMLRWAADRIATLEARNRALEDALGWFRGGEERSRYAHETADADGFGADTMWHYRTRERLDRMPAHVKAALDA